MRFLAVAVLAICLLHGSSAQPQLSSFRSLVSDAASKVSSAASGAISAAQSAAQTAANKVSDAVQNVLNAADNLSIDQLTDLASKLSADELLETVEQAEAKIEAGVNATVNTLSNAVDNVESQAKDAITSATANLDPEVQSVINKAVDAGLNVTDCSTDAALALGKNAVIDVVECGTEKVKTALNLIKNMTSLVPRAKELTQTVKSNLTDLKACTSGSLVENAKCAFTEVKELKPVLVESFKLLSESAKYSTEAVKLVTTLQASLQACAAGVVANQAFEAASAGAGIISCVSNKISA